MNDVTDSAVSRGLRASAWLFYCVIVFEILFMVSPFALYYYSLYAMPLNWLQQSASTAWLTLHILPHFAYSQSWLSNSLLLLAWPLILVGLLLFFVGFVQIYRSKLTRKANVEVGLYRYSRHPQYVALAIIGLGASIYWSRFIIVVTYVTMLLLYYWLARHEERVCVEKFGDPYREYQSTTGMFLPKSWLRWMPKVDILPTIGWKRVAAGGTIYAVVVALTVIVGWGVKRHVLGRVTLYGDGDTVFIALAPIPRATLTRLHTMLSNDEAYQRHLPRKALVYVVPSSWNVPELGLASSAEHEHHGLSILLQMSTHGNSLDFDRDRLTILLTEPVLVDPDAQGKEMVLVTLGYVPKLRIELDMKHRSVIAVSDQPHASQWKGIPVPVY